MEFVEFKGKTVDEAITAATIQLGVTSNELIYEVVDKGNTGILGFINAKPAIIKAKKKVSLNEKTEEYLNQLFKAMDIDAVIDIEYDDEKKQMDINLAGQEMGILIGKRGQTLDALQYLISLFVNKDSEEYIRIKLDTENYRARRRDTLETLAKNIAFKVKRSKRPVTLEPMNPYERRIIHSVLQNDKYVMTRSEGEEPNRRVVVELKRNNDHRYEKHHESKAE